MNNRAGFPFPNRYRIVTMFEFYINIGIVRDECVLIFLIENIAHHKSHWKIHIKHELLIGNKGPGPENWLINDSRP